MIAQFLRKYASGFFAILGMLTYLGCREFGLAPWLAFAIGLMSVIFAALLLRRKPPGTRLD